MSYTYSTLTDDIIANMEEDSDEFVSALPFIIARAQTYLQKRIDSLPINQFVSVAVSAGVRSVTLPSDLLIVRSFAVQNADGWTNLIQQTNEYLTSYWPDYTSVGESKYYANATNSEIFLAPTPVSTTDGLLEYVATVPTLTSAAPTNWLSENASDAFFAAGMMYANMWTKNGEASSIWKANADEHLTVLNNEAKRMRRSDTSDRNSGAPENNLGGTP